MILKLVFFLLCSILSLNYAQTKTAQGQMPKVLLNVTWDEAALIKFGKEFLHGAKSEWTAQHSPEAAERKKTQDSKNRHNQKVLEVRVLLAQ